jgi:triphosphatase
MATPDQSAEKYPGPDTTRPSSPVEVELKLLVAPGTLDQFRKSSILVGPARNKGVVRLQEAIYYDTADHELFRAGLSLRVRRSGKHFTQTVKRMSCEDALTRHEWEAPVAAMIPDLGALPVAEIGSPLDNLDAEALVPIMTTKVRRHILQLDLTDAHIEVAFDDGMIEAAEHQEPISEIELELKRGKAAALYELGLSLMDAGPLRFGTQNKSARGYALISGEIPKAVKAGASGIEREDTADEAIAKLMSNCKHQILANLFPAESGSDPDGIHQLRVALRRLRTLLWFLRREIAAPSLMVLEGDAKYLAQSFGPARNWDVFVGSTLSNIEKAGLPDIKFDKLRDTSAPLRENSYTAVSKTIADPQTNRFLLSLGLVIEQRSWRNDIASETLAVLAEPVSKFSARVLARTERKALKLGRNFRQLHPDERHKLRLTLKKLRYTLEFFLPLYSRQPSTNKYLKRLSRLQDALGADNDIATSRALLHELTESTDDPDVQRAIGAVIGWQRCHQLAQADRLKEAWRKFEHQALFRNR